MARPARRPTGFAIILTLFVLTLVFVIGMAMQAVTATQLQEMGYWRSANQSYYYAKAGLNRGIAELVNDTNYTTTGNGVTGNVGSGTYTFTITPDPNNATRPLQQWQIQSTGRVGATKRILTAWVKQDTFAKYSFFTDHETTSGGTTLWMKTGDVLKGPVHTNGFYSFSGHPSFDATVTSANTGDSDYNSTPHTYTQGGTTYADSAKFYRYYYNYATDSPTAVSGANGYSFNGGAANVDLPSNTEIRDLLHDNADLTLDGNHTLVFNANGTITVTPASGSTYTVTVPSGGYIIWVNNGQTKVSGTVKGNITLGTNNTISITGNVLYNDKNTDVLGLVADQNITVDVNKNVAANLEIDAVMLAASGSFSVGNYNTGVYRGILTVYGGIIQQYRGPVGTFNAATQINMTGYTKNYGYDPKLATNPPVNFPTTGQLVTKTFADNQTL